MPESKGLRLGTRKHSAVDATALTAKHFQYSRKLQAKPIGLEAVSSDADRRQTDDAYRRQTWLSCDNESKAGQRRQKMAQQRP